MCSMLLSDDLSRLGQSRERAGKEERGGRGQGEKLGGEGSGAGHWRGLRRCVLFDEQTLAGASAGRCDRGHAPVSRYENARWH